MKKGISRAVSDTAARSIMIKTGYSLLDLVMETTDLDMSSFNGMPRQRPGWGGSKSQWGNWRKQVQTSLRGVFL